MAYIRMYSVDCSVYSVERSYFGVGKTKQEKKRLGIAVSSFLSFFLVSSFFSSVYGWSKSRSIYIYTDRRNVAFTEHTSFTYRQNSSS